MGKTVRASTDELDHIRCLIEDDSGWGAVLARRSDGVIADGVHRYRAALARGDQSLGVEYFEGDDSELFIESVRRNVRHGKPLTLAEKRAAATQILALRPEWSDRWIADLCALSPKMVSSLRRKSGTAVSASERRLGRDGRSRRLVRSMGVPAVRPSDKRLGDGAAGNPPLR